MRRAALTVAIQIGRDGKGVIWGQMPNKPAKAPGTNLGNNAAPGVGRVMLR